MPALWSSTPSRRDDLSLLVLRENIYTDPQKPIQVQPGVYEINSPKPESPVLVTTNFSITYFAVANEVEGSGLPAWLVVTDAEGMSVLTAWAAGKFDAERIAKAIKGFDVASKVSRKRSSCLVTLPSYRVKWRKNYPIGRSASDRARQWTCPRS
jgi:acetyl-CoA decarbonylase/synthase, CODH/ACS complex subunit gamma